jgi:membrane-bound ClpP family serine protease
MDGVRRGVAVIILGVVLLILGAVLNISILWTLGIILVLVGVVLWALGTTGRTIGPRAHYW